MKSNKCVQCGVELSADVRFCSNCGACLHSGGKCFGLNGVMSKKAKTVLTFVCAGVALIVCYVILTGILSMFGCDIAGIFKKVVANPPIVITARGGLLSDAVIRVHNESDNDLFVSACIYHGAHYDRTGVRKVKSGDHVDFGTLEFSGKWRPEAGNKGFIMVKGYNSVGMFELVNDQTYRTWFDKGIPNDIPKGLKNSLFSPR